MTYFVLTLLSIYFGTLQSADNDHKRKLNAVLDAEIISATKQQKTVQYSEKIEFLFTNNHTCNAYDNVSKFLRVQNGSIVKELSDALNNPATLRVEIPYSLTSEILPIILCALPAKKEIQKIETLLKLPNFTDAEKIKILRGVNSFFNYIRGYDHIISYIENLPITQQLLAPSVVFHFYDKNTIELSSRASQKLVSNQSCILHNLYKYGSKTEVHLDKNILYDEHIKVLLESIDTETEALNNILADKTLGFDKAQQTIKRLTKFFMTLKGHSDIESILRSSPLAILMRMLYENDFSENDFGYLKQLINNKPTIATQQHLHSSQEIFIDEFIFQIDSLTKCMRRYSQNSMLQALFQQCMNTHDNMILIAALQIKTNKEKSDAHLSFIEYCLNRLKNSYDLNEMIQLLRALKTPTFDRKDLNLTTPYRTYNFFECVTVKQLSQVTNTRFAEHVSFAKLPESDVEKIFFSTLPEQNRVTDPKTIALQLAS